MSTRSTATTLSQTEIKSMLDAHQIEIKGWADLHRRLGQMADTAWIFRGVASPEHYPIPSIGRESVFGPYKRAQEERLFRAFKDRAITLVSGRHFDDWHWLAYAQHLGVPTRLLDWTISPLIGVFFSVIDENHQDRLLYCLKYSTYIHEVDSSYESPFDCKSEGRFSPPFIFDRIRAQRGIFTIHPDPTKIFYKSNMKVIRIPHRYVGEIRKKIFKYGVDYWSMFPDGEGLALQLRWQYRSKIGLGSLFLNSRE